MKARSCLQVIGLAALLSSCPWPSTGAPADRLSGTLLAGPRYQTLRGLAGYVETTARGALEGAVDDARHGTPSDASFLFSIRAFALAAAAFHQRVDAYEQTPFDVTSEVAELAARARTVDEKIHAANALESTYDEWSAIRDGLDRTAALLAGHDVEVPAAYVVPALSGPALAQFRQLAHDLELSSKRAHATAKREVGKYERGPQLLGELEYFAAEMRVLHLRADAEDVSPQELGPIVNHLLEEARQADRRMRDAQTFPQVWDDSGRTIVLLERMATLVRS
jgi:hypothetical protein